MKILKNLLLSLGSATAIVAPVTTIVACGDTDNKKPAKKADDKETKKTSDNDTKENGSQDSDNTTGDSSSTANSGDSVDSSQKGNSDGDATGSGDTSSNTQQPIVSSLADEKTKAIEYLDLIVSSLDPDIF
ncbi:hypothetical protein ElyMa_000505600 [Elysia marginata]|uniref:Lipoprotein n=1 Tax=Elysia marginata TaxID=1093978 RepID=A0AAV4FWJ8_9GAST|nr:hypothetical protein ElyMa_000505600 [Elysia marginata]